MSSTPLDLVKQAKKGRAQIDAGSSPVQPASLTKSNEGRHMKTGRFTRFQKAK